MSVSEYFILNSEYHTFTEFSLLNDRKNMFEKYTNYVIVMNYLYMCKETV